MPIKDLPAYEPLTMIHWSDPSRWSTVLTSLVPILQINATYCPAAERVLDGRLHYLRSGAEREWAEFYSGRVPGVVGAPSSNLASHCVSVSR